MPKAGVLEDLTDLARRREMALLWYQKAVGDISVGPRLVEPYSYTQGKQDVMVRCFQVEPEEGWRFFMHHRIREVQASGKPFHPRTKTTICDGVLHETFAPWDQWTEIAKEYRNLIVDALADMNLDEGERESIRAFSSLHGIPEQTSASVRCSIFHACMTHFLDDGIMTVDERRQLRIINGFLQRLGGGIFDTTDPERSRP